MLANEEINNVDKINNLELYELDSDADVLDLIIRFIVDNYILFTLLFFAIIIIVCLLIYNKFNNSKNLKVDFCKANPLTDLGKILVNHGINWDSVSQDAKIDFRDDCIIIYDKYIEYNITKFDEHELINEKSNSILKKDLSEDQSKKISNAIIFFNNKRLDDFKKINKDNNSSDIKSIVNIVCIEARYVCFYVDHSDILRFSNYG